ncbi:virulence factor [Polymorphum gilvum]|uniref:Virulence factor domain-containing protein n=1 Tax=Polymorphum gilvum (strain LMG 25793 / CGMCC 1.9160 / SL003B-26A1) TaxID=991905 RepID=F2J5U4_POLGS|nr:virulence factor [Polymorphum gilvum]ADZ71198.1 hypothetical protein SL003B_2775 [Polymorphum gilvum SL003B-26A1]
MAHKIIVYWRDIPAQVLVRAERKSARRELPAAFLEAIDAAAMRAGRKDEDAYLAAWRRADPIEVGEDIEAEADAALNALVATYPRTRLLALVENSGVEA